MKNLFRLFVLLLFAAVPAIAAPGPRFYASAFAHPRLPDAAEASLSAAAGQSGGGHGTALTWTASSSAATCVAPCTLTYNVYRGTAAGAESITPENSSPITALTFFDPVLLTGSSQTFYYIVEA